MYQLHIQTEVDKITKSRNPGEIYKWNPGALVNKCIDFTIGVDGTIAQVVNGPHLGPCPDASDEDGLSIMMSEAQLAKYSPTVGDVVTWTPQGCLYSADPILTVTRSGIKIKDLNDDLDIICG